MTGQASELSTIHGLVQHWAARAPDAIAARCGDRRLSYRDLDARSSAVARALAGAQIGRESLVAVAVPRSLEYLIGILGVLKAGAGYVPLDLDYPRERIQWMLSDCGARAGLAVEETSGRLELPDDVALIDINRPLPPGTDDPRDGERPAAEVGPDGIAYVVYTSGSTGTPKGVCVTHANVLSLLRTDERLAVAPGDRIAQLAPVSFDASTFEIWAALCNGGEIMIMPGPSLSLDDLALALREHTPSRIFLTTGLFHVLADQDLAALASVATLLTGGDVLSPAKIAKAAGVTRTMAAYGPTETTVFASLHEIAPAPGDAAVPIGTPLDGVSMRIVAADLGEAETGGLGEIAIGGAGVARGYHRRPALTADRFRPDPVPAVPGARMYLTGDLGRQRPDGVFEFHGRRDRQVKVRGHRVELSEIESSLSAHPDCAAAVAITVDFPGAEKRLVAYLAMVEGAETSLSQFQDWLRERLPAYAIPAKLCELPEIPLDANGKSDRRLLPNPWISRDALVDAKPFVEPRDELEMDIAELWAEVLDLDRVGVTDDFFELGGDSLRSVSLLTRLGHRGIRLSAGDLFANASVGACSALVRSRNGRPERPSPAYGARELSVSGEG